ncbi:MAG: ABC transporter ATP-binding protein [Pseudomonadota bacterium]
MRRCWKPTSAPTGRTAAVLLEASALNVRYGANHAVRDVSLEVADGEIVAILGANGAGKSSLLKAIAGAAAFESGTVEFAGKALKSGSASARVKRGLVLVPEGRQIFVSLTVEENLLMGAYTRSDGGVAADAEAMFDRFPNLASRRAALASVLSGGEQQMLAIARALIGRPKLLMLDEPSLGLSPILVEQLFKLIGDLNREGLSILLVEQNTHMALEVAHRAAVLELGRVVAEGSAAELAADPRVADAYLGAAA